MLVDCKIGASYLNARHDVELFGAHHQPAETRRRELRRVLLALSREVPQHPRHIQNTNKYAPRQHVGWLKKICMGNLRTLGVTSSPGFQDWMPPLAIAPSQIATR